MSFERDVRPWGMYEVVDRGHGYQVKRIEVHPGHRFSLQRHSRRTEHWVIVSGRALATVGDNELMLGENQHVLIPAGTRHRIANTGSTPLIFIEVQFGSYLGEDDIERFEDDYNRTDPSPGRSG